MLKYVKWEEIDKKTLNSVPKWEENTKNSDLFL